VLTENTLYTTEGWTTFLDHLDEGGLLSVSRWYYPTRPGEAYRLVSLANDALTATGAADPRAHVVMITASAFVCIGLGFMFVEISQMQRLMVFLGHPTYALSVVLFTLLAGTGLGSFAAES